MYCGVFEPVSTSLWKSITLEAILLNPNYFQNKISSVFFSLIFSFPLERQLTILLFYLQFLLSSFLVRAFQI